MPHRLIAIKYLTVLMKILSKSCDFMWLTLNLALHVYLDTLHEATSPFP